MTSSTGRRVEPDPVRPLRPPGQTPAHLAARFAEVRRATEQLCQPLGEEDCVVQSMDDASPVKWHLAHTTWFFEVFVLESATPDYEPFRADYKVLFNSYYNTVGEQYPRPRRGLLSRPPLSEIFEYRRHVDRLVLELLEAQTDSSAKWFSVVEIGLNHEQQHQELILTDVKHLLSCNPIRPAYRSEGSEGSEESDRSDRSHRESPASEPAGVALIPLRWQPFEEGLSWQGHGSDDFCFDNERPRHRAFVQGFELASRLITNSEYLEFMEDSGYERPELWLSDGWIERERQGWTAPLYWNRDGEVPNQLTLSGVRPLQGSEPVCHLSYYEADAFARWKGVRLPTEAEWEIAASDGVVSGNFVERGLLHPAPAVENGEAPVQLFGDTWEWTQSAYSAYPGYRAATGALGEYNGKFMSNQMVLRGGSCATPASHMRASYRNFFAASARWQFSGLRLARDRI